VGKLTVQALRVVLVVVLAGTVFVQAAIVAAALVWLAVTLFNAPGQRDDRASR